MMVTAAMMMGSEMYTEAHEYEVAVEHAWRDYINACEDLTVPYYRVVEYRDAYERVLNDCPCNCATCKP